MIRAFMAKAAHPSGDRNEISFELESFTLDGDQIKLSGRWFGVRGRRFVRPTLTPVGGQDRDRLLADLEHKPWAAEDGQPWEAAFPRLEDRDATRYEMSVAPDIAIALPSPSGKLGSPRRLAALPRRPAVSTAWRAPQRDQGAERERAAEQEHAAEQEQAAERERAAEQARAAERERVEREQAAERERAAEQERAAERERAAEQERAAEREHFEQAVSTLTSSLELAEAEREGLRSELAALREELETLRRALDEREQLTLQRDQLTSELSQANQALTELRSEQQQTSASLEQLARERDEAIRAHGAALVMRGAARAAPKRSWWRR